MVFTEVKLAASVDNKNWLSKLKTVFMIAMIKPLIFT